MLSPMTKLIHPIESFGANLGGAPEILTGRPTVAQNNAATTSKALARGFQQAGELAPEWCRLPAPGARCKFSGLSRTSLNEAIERGDIRAITIRQHGATRGIRLISVPSLQSWLDKLDTDQNSTAKKGGVR